MDSYGPTMMETTCLCWKWLPLKKGVETVGHGFGTRGVLNRMWRVMVIRIISKRRRWSGTLRCNSNISGLDSLASTLAFNEHLGLINTKTRCGITRRTEMNLMNGGARPLSLGMLN